MLMLIEEYAFETKCIHKFPNPVTSPRKKFKLGLTYILNRGNPYSNRVPAKYFYIILEYLIISAIMSASSLRYVKFCD